MKKSELAGLTVSGLKALAKKNKVTLPAGATKDAMIGSLMKGAAGEEPKAKVKAATKATAKTSGSAPKATKTATAAKKKEANKKPAKKKPASPGPDRKKPAAKKAPARKAPAKKAPPRRAGLPEGLEEPLMAQERVSFAKFFTGAPEHLLKTPSEALPAEYGRERVVVLARDPDVVFAYWEVPQERLQSEQAAVGGGRLSIRVYDVTGVAFDGTNATAYFDQDVYERVGSWYFDLHRPGRKFCADIGLRSSDGRFHTIARSNATVMPRDAVTDAIDEQWTVAAEAFAKIYGVPGWALSGMSSQDIQEMLRQRRMADVTSPGAKAGQAAKK